MAKSTRLVIDACVARASGRPGSKHPTSVKCQHFLDAVRTTDHRVVFTPSIRAEWNKHESRFASTWRAKMNGRKRIVLLNTGRDEALRRRLTKLASDSAISEIILKDCHLLEAALDSDKRIVSLETTSFGHLRRIARGVKELSDVALVNPVDDAQEPLKWLREGAPIGRKHRLMSRAGEA